MPWESVVQETAFNLLKQAVIFLPNDVKQALEKAFREETSEMGRTQLKAILKNIEFAEKNEVPLCQDTGTIIFYIKVGRDSKSWGAISEAVTMATKRATEEVPLRPNAVNPFTQENSGDNTGRLIPWINWDVISGDEVELTVLPKGGGSENTCVMDILVPGEGIRGVKKFVVDSVLKAGSKPCPPNILGIGIGGGADIAMKLAKEALLRPLNVPNPDPEIEKLEDTILEAINMTGIGPMGLGGKTTALGVNIDYAYRHPASYPVAIAFNCWAARRASAKISPDGTVEYS
ncbi:MAG: fumarate hydratase [Thermoproteota archaeon]